MCGGVDWVCRDCGEIVRFEHECKASEEAHVTSNDWRQDDTRCIARKKDGTQCKLEVGPGEMFCEHHNYDLRAFIRNPLEVVALYGRYFPKQHHPACDRKGANDCDCPNLPLASLFARTLRRCFNTSLKQTPEWKEEQRLVMRRRTRAIRRFYQKMDPNDLWLPPNAQWRQIRFFVWEEKKQLMRVMKLKDTFRDNQQGKKALQRRLVQFAPHHVYYSTGAWLNPQSIGPDPLSKGGKKKFKKRGMHPVLNNTFLFRELYFDVDYEMETFHQAAEETKKLLEWYKDQEIVSDEEPVVVFSGGKGFHVIDFGWKIEPNLHGPMKDRYLRLFDREREKHLPSHKLQRLDKAWKKWFVKQVRNEGILIDFDVTPDPRRIIRLPGTIHGKKGRLCRIIGADELEDFDTGPTLW